MPHTRHALAAYARLVRDAMHAAYKRGQAEKPLSDMEAATAFLDDRRLVENVRVLVREARIFL